jgi:uncharacterized protein involved in response to NO
VSFDKIWKPVLAVTLALLGLWYLDIIDFSSAPDLIGVGALATAVLLVLDK